MSIKKALAICLLVTMLIPFASCVSDIPDAEDDSESESSSVIESEKDSESESESEKDSEKESESETESESESENEDLPPLAKKTYYAKESLDKIKVFGRSHSVTDGITCDHSASGIEFTGTFEGDVTVKIISERQNQETAKNDDAYFTVYIDGVRQSTRHKVGIGATKSLKVATGLKRGTHTVKILKQSEAKNGSCIISSVVVYGTLDSAPASKPLIEFIGDSLTAGYGILCSNGTASSGDTDYKDATKSFAYLTAEKLGADHSLVACSGSGITQGFRPVLAASLFSLQNYYRSTSKAYAPTRTPDTVVINLGTNDHSKGSDKAQFKSDVATLIALIRTTYGKNVNIVWAYNMMKDGYKAEILEVLDSLGGEDAGLYSVELNRNTSGGNGHPSETAQATAATTLAAFIEDKDLLNPENVAPPTPTEPDRKTAYSVVENISKIKVHGRSETLTDGITCDFSACGIEFTVVGKGDVYVTITNGRNTSVDTSKSDDAYFTVYINGVRQDGRPKVASGETTDLRVATLAAEGTYVIKLIKQTEIKNGLCVIKNVTFEGTLGDRPADKDLYIEFLGDSITSGYGNLWTSSSDGAAADSDNKDATKAYSYLTAEALGADHSLISCGGVGVTLGWRSFLAKDLFSKQSYHRNQTKAYTPVKTPDLIVINLGTNDQTKNANRTEFKADVQSYIQLVRSTYGSDVKIVWAYGMMMDGYQSEILAAISELGGESAGLYSVKLTQNTAAGGGHPSTSGHATASAELVAFIRNKNLLG